MTMNNRLITMTTVFALVFCLRSVGAGRVIYVDNSGPADFRTIQAAIDDANNGDTVVIKPGTYAGDGNRDISFKGKAITVQSAGPNDPDTVTRTVIECRGTESNPHRGFQFISGEGPDSILAGLKIVNGYGPMIRFGYYDNSVGGAILCLRSGPTIRYCQLVGNTAGYYGGGVYCAEANTTITDCTIVQNTAMDGGGVYCADANVVVDRCAFRGNVAGSYGGAVYLKEVRATISNCLMATNMSRSYGGAVFCQTNVVLSMTGCTVADNMARRHVGGVDPYARNQHNVVTLDNCILWNNQAEGKCDKSTQVSDEPVTVLYSCVQGWPGPAGIEGNMGENPLLTPDYHLQANSPCIDAGDSGDPNALSARDIDGEPRVSSGRIDLGCDEVLDVDSDGLPDSWEIAQFGAVELSSGVDDPDGDSRDNAQEYRDGGNPHFPSGICYVDPEHGNDSWDGLAATRDDLHGPKATIQAAIDYVGARDGDQVVLLPGVYSGQGNRDIDFRGKAITVRSTDPNDPAVVARTIVDCQGQGDELHRAFLFTSREAIRSSLQGITMIKGHVADDGGAIKCDIGSSPTIVNCVFTQNNAVQGGGAIYCGLCCNPIMRGCSIEENTAQFGAGIHSYEQSSPWIAQCRIEANSARIAGGAIYTGYQGPQSGPVITGCRISRNRASDGGAILCNRSDVTLVNSVLSGNVATGSGGAVYCYQSAPSFTNCTIVDNSAARYGGAFAGDGHGWTTSLVLFENCIIWGNSASSGDAIDRGGCTAITGCPSVMVVFSCLPADGGAFGQETSRGWEIDFGSGRTPLVLTPATICPSTRCPTRILTGWRASSMETAMAMPLLTWAPGSGNQRTSSTVRRFVVACRRRASPTSSNDAAPRYRCTCRAPCGRR
jgi:predicted outer membrane repeat protein